MCFSASASFTAATVLMGIGAVTVRRARTRRELPCNRASAPGRCWGRYLGCRCC